MLQIIYKTISPFYRFMRGERDPSIIYRPGFPRSEVVPNTPSIASSAGRQNPLLFQRMHSNDSDKDSTNVGNGSGRQSD